MKISAYVLPILFLITGNAAMAAEEPAFTVIVDDGALQVRQYPELLVAETSVQGDRKDASNAGFKILAGYIFGDNTRRQKIAMTAPVMQSPPENETIAMTAPVSQTASGSAWIIRFTMPSGYALDTLPKPNDSRVALSAVPPARFAVIRFSGWASDEDFNRKHRELERWVAKRGLHASGPASLAQYNPPWTLGPLRRNEVMLPLEATHSP